MKHKIKTEKQRNKLAPRTAPYYETLAPGRSIGWRAYKSGLGVWVARYNGIYTLKGSGNLSYEEGLILVLKHFSNMDEPESITVGNAITAYVADLRVRKGISAEVSTRKRLESHCKPLMQTPVVELTKDDLRNWMNALPGTASTVNRVRAMLIAALNLTDCDPAAWRKLRQLPVGDTARKLVLTKNESLRLLSVTHGAFHNLLKAATLTGARLGELRKLTVSDLYNGQLTLDGKTGERIIPLRNDALDFFESLTIGKNDDAPLLPASDGRAWRPGKHSHCMAKAVIMANLPRNAVNYTLRHTFISNSIDSGVPIAIIAQYCGVSVAGIEKHYAHFTPSRVKDSIDSVNLFQQEYQR